MTASLSSNNNDKLTPAWHIIIYFAIIHVVALLAFLPQFFSWKAIAVSFVLYCLTGGVGVTLGFHRLISHRSFTAPKWLEYILLFCGTLSCQGGPIDWVGLHRMHHKFSDTAPDPHDSNRGFWWSHMGWMLFNIPADKDIPRYTQDIKDDPFYLFCQKWI